MGTHMLLEDQTALVKQFFKIFQLLSKIDVGAISMSALSASASVLLDLCRILVLDSSEPTNPGTLELTPAGHTNMEKSLKESISLLCCLTKNQYEANDSTENSQESVVDFDEINCEDVRKAHSPSTSDGLDMSVALEHLDNQFLKTNQSVKKRKSFDSPEETIKRSGRKMTKRQKLSNLEQETYWKSHSFSAQEARIFGN